MKLTFSQLVPSRQMPQSTVIPESLYRYFWDYDTDQGSFAGSRHTILLRLMQEGGLDAVGWLRQNASDDELRALLIRRDGRGISPKRLRFWALLLDLPDAQVDRWVAAERSSVWNRRTD
jgi:hypothetical protein